MIRTSILALAGDRSLARALLEFYQLLNGKSQDRPLRNSRPRAWARLETVTVVVTD